MSHSDNTFVEKFLAKTRNVEKEYAQKCARSCSKCALRTGKIPVVYKIRAAPPPNGFYPKIRCQQTINYDCDRRVAQSRCAISDSTKLLATESVGENNPNAGGTPFLRRMRREVVRAPRLIAA